MRRTIVIEHEGEPSSFGHRPQGRTTFQGGGAGRRQRVMIVCPHETCGAQLVEPAVQGSGAEAEAGIQATQIRRPRGFNRPEKEPVQRVKRFGMQDADRGVEMDEIKSPDPQSARP